MTKKLLKLFNVGLLILSVICVLYLVFLKFTNPDMTEMRFLITYYKEIIISFIALIVSSLSMRSK